MILHNHQRNHILVSRNRDLATDWVGSGAQMVLVAQVNSAAKRWLALFRSRREKGNLSAPVMTDNVLNVVWA